jgi:hypothetical protein
MKVAEAQRKPSDLVNPLIKHKVVSVEEKIDEMCAFLETVEEATLFTLLSQADSRSELVARFMGILELIKLRRVIITTVTVIEDVVEYNETGLEMSLKLNPDYIPPETSESEFDHKPEENEDNEND